MGAEAACLVERCGRGQAGYARADDDNSPLCWPKALQACAAYTALRCPAARTLATQAVQSVLE